MFQKTTLWEWIKTSATLKLFFIGFLVLLLLIPTLMVYAVINDREGRLNEAKNEVSEKWGGVQIISGPVLTVPYQRYSWDEKGKIISATWHSVHFLPESLAIEGGMAPEVRSRGIFDVILYTADLKITGYFEPSATGVSADTLFWDRARLSVGITDMKGLKEVPQMEWDGSALALESGLSGSSPFSSGVGAEAGGVTGGLGRYAFTLTMKLNGSERIRFAPMGKVTTASLKSAWPSPSFDGAFLPTGHTIDSSGFTAEWKVLDLNRNFPQIWDDQNYSANSYEFGVKLVRPVDAYQQTARSVKYAALFIVLTFLAYFLVEVLKKIKVHPIQYLLVGFALVLFYLLLLSFSEYLTFPLAYLLASLGIIGMVSLYTGAILKKKSFAFMQAAILTALYIYLYVLLQLQDFSLLLGSLGLFLILSAVMFLTRKVDWYGMNEKGAE